MNRRNFLRNVAYSAGLVALSACRLRIEDPLLRMEEGEPREVFSVFRHTQGIEPGEYRAGTKWDALLDYCVKDVELTERLRAVMPIVSIDPGYQPARTQQSQDRLARDGRVRGLHQYHGVVTGRWGGKVRHWTPAYAVGDKIKVHNSPGNDGIYIVTMINPKQGVVDVEYHVTEDDHG